VCLGIAVVLFGAVADLASARGPQKLRLPAPAWLTPELRQEIQAAGPAGRAMPEDLVFKSCPGVGPTVPGVQAGTCLVDPYGCTANFVFYNGPTVRDATGALRPAGGLAGAPALPPFTSNGQNWFLGTAGHCLKSGTVLGQVRPPGIYLPGSDAGGIAAIGKTYKKMDAGIGKDFGAIRIGAGFSVTPSTPLGAPRGVFTGCTPLPIDYYGHGYHFAVAQGKGGGGNAFWPSTAWYTWAGTSFGGDSGSGVTLPDRSGAGNLTHGLGLAGGLVPLPVGYGTRMTRILDYLGRGFHLVNADGTLARATSACTGLGAPWDQLVRRGSGRRR
jgi:hypothetical protein